MSAKQSKCPLVWTCLLVVCLSRLAHAQDAGILVIDDAVDLANSTFSADSSLVATVGDAIRIYDIGLGELKQTIRTPVRTSSIVFCPDQPDHYIVGNAEGQLLRYQLDDPEPLKTVKIQSRFVERLVYSPDNEWLVTCGTRTGKEEDGIGEVRICDPLTLELVESIETPGFYARGIAFSPDGRIMAIATQTDKLVGSSSKIFIYNVRDWTLKNEITFGLGFASGAAFHPNGESLLTCGGEPFASSPTSFRVEGRMWQVDLSGDDPVQRLDVEAGTGVYREPDLARDGSFFVTANTVIQSIPGGTSVIAEIQCRNPLTGQLFWSQEAGVGGAHGVRVSPDGRVIVACNREKIFLFHAKTGHQITEFEAKKVE